jgi:hypothetical protein
LSHEIGQAESTTQSASRVTSLAVKKRCRIRLRQRKRRLGEPFASHEPVGGKIDDAVVRRPRLNTVSLPSLARRIPGGDCHCREFVCACRVKGSAHRRGWWTRPAITRYKRACSLLPGSSRGVPSPALAGSVGIEHRIAESDYAFGGLILAANAHNFLRLGLGASLAGGIAVACDVLEVRVVAGFSVTGRWNGREVRAPSPCGSTRRRRRLGGAIGRQVPDMADDRCSAAISHTSSSRPLSPYWTALSYPAVLCHSERVVIIGT